MLLTIIDCPASKLALVDKWGSYISCTDELLEKLLCFVSRILVLAVPGEDNGSRLHAVVFFSAG